MSNNRKKVVFVTFLMILIVVFVLAGVSLFMLKKYTKVNNETSKVWLAIGDSITYGEGCDEKSYIDYIQERTSYETLKRAYGGIGIKQLCVLNNDFIGDVDHVDVVTVLIGTNDFGFDTSLEEFDYYIKSYMDYLKERFPDARIIFCTLLYRDYYGTKIKTVSGQTNNIGKNISEYNTIIVENAKTKEIDVIDLYNEEVINKDNIRTFTYDGLHPNSNGQKKIAYILTEKINKYLEIQ